MVSLLLFEFNSTNSGREMEGISVIELLEISKNTKLCI